MDTHPEKEKSSKRTREERDHRDRHRERDRDREHKHRSRDGDDNRHRDSDHHPHRHLRSDRDSKREHSHERRDHKSRRERSREPRDEREGSRDRDSTRERSYDWREEREGSRERAYDREGKRERSYELRNEREGSRDREESVERRNSYSQKRKEREYSEDRDDREEKKTRVSEERKERRRFEDKVEDGKELNDGGRRERKRWDKVKKEDDIEDGKKVDVNEFKVKEEFTDNDAQGISTAKGSASAENGFSLGSSAIGSRSVPESSVAPNNSLPIKVSSISTPNENKGVSITRSHEVTGKSSTDGSSSTAGKGGSLSLDVLAKAKLALQKQKEVSEKLKKLSELKSGSTSDAHVQSGSEDKSKFSTHSVGVASMTATAASVGPAANMSTLPTTTVASTMPQASGTIAPVDIAKNYEAVKRAQELAARMGFRQDPQFGPLINMFPGQMVTDIAIPQKPTKVPVLRLDALGREIDEHGNVVNVTKPSNLSTLKVNINKQKKDAFQILKPVLDVDPESNPHFDSSMGINKTKLLRPKRMSFQFVEEGKWSKEAETIKLKSKFGEAQAKEQKAKQAQLAKAKAAPDINPNLIEIKERVVIKEKPKESIPDVEWWDVPLLIGGSYGDIMEGTIGESILKMDKITFYLEHPRPIEPPAEPAPPPPQPLKLTKKEQKKLRTQRRLAKEKDRQEMIRQGVIEPPKPKVKISNLMKVLGTEATQDPTRLEKEIRSAAAEREQAHIDRNIARKLTPAERREKKERKLFDDPSTLETLVSVYRINELSHPKARFRVDVNAQENRLTGCAVISDGISVVAVEGGSKSIKRYGKLMLRRINWSDLSKEEEEEGDSDDDKPVNKCSLVWQGSVAKPSFSRFSVHECMTESAARKIFADAGVGHYWDLAVNFVDDEV
ncbi:hypothetical protein L6164_005546 [Bauhinia variegata]|uniref:Uncharacterized protein n=1 Tax=Bauhinia variegata TaxID=167791 RepID=A0ACB9PU93_BAUVA|nr:hypothetical protein L6164_005546 [Bauhinia variegata]